MTVNSHDVGRLRPVFGNLNTRCTGGDRFGWPLRFGAGFRVKRLELAGPAGHPEQDAGSAFATQLVGRQTNLIEPVQPACTERTGAGETQESAPAHGFAATADPHFHPASQLLGHD